MSPSGPQVTQLVSLDKLHSQFTLFILDIYFNYIVLQLFIFKNYYLVIILLFKLLDIVKIASIVVREINE